MRKSEPLISLLAALLYLVVIIAAGTVASRRGLCGEGDFAPSCAMFTTAIALYGLLAVGIISVLVVLGAALLRRHVPSLLKTCCTLQIAALLSIALPVRAVGDKLAGAIVVMLMFPIAVVLQKGVGACFVNLAGASGS